MCGIVGLVHRYDPSASLPLGGAAEARAALAGWTASAPDAAARLGDAVADLEALSLALVGWAGFRSLREDAEGRNQVAGLARELKDYARAAVAHVEAGAAGSSKAAEALSRAVVLARDVAWRLSQDALPNLERAASLLGEPTAEQSLKTWFELWRVNLVLNQLERLEVRGRDSGGLGTQIVLDGSAWTDFEAGLSDHERSELTRRSELDAMPDGGVLRCERADGRVVVAFVHKVAKEVGELGANVADLRAKLRADTLWLALVGQESANVQVIAHTRWASNGIISEPNCHPVANDQSGVGLGGRLVLGVLNGDVDNFPTLAQGYRIPVTCTTDAKIIPLEIAKRAGADADFAGALREAAANFDGSTAIGIVASDDPEAVWLTQRGSGQAIYVGYLGSGGYLYASELYGVVELAPEFHKLNGEAGEIVRLDEHGALQSWSYSGLALPAPQTKRAPIATRDIDRAGHPHYFVKEITDAPRSVERTLRGKFVLEGEKGARFLMGEDVVPTAVREGLSAKTIRRVFVIGQGTACVAGLAAADFMGRLLQPVGISVTGMPATDLSGFLLDQVGADTLVVAVSQSGTTTDTNRTVDLARQRGANVIGIVNRRGSDLADKSDGVLYTSDGRDVEMSVASTKAFYCQVVAGYLLSLCLAEQAGAVSQETLAAHLLRMQDLPRCLREVLNDSRDRIKQAARLALRRRHWTVVGSGPLTHAAREIRIKLSELCYKSVSADTIEDKKHIDLSSEPMLLVCAAGLVGAAAADAVKEVAIFKAHAGIPVVICDRGETRFAEYASATIEVPATTPEVAVLLNTIAGHLFSYEVARAIDDLSQPLRQARELVQAALTELQGADPTESLETLERLEVALEPVRREVFAAVAEGLWNAGTGSDRTFQICRALLPGRFVPDGWSTPRSPLVRVEGVLSDVVAAIEELRRPIDAIKHQAKTVTVGISRDENATRPKAGPLIEALEGAGVEATMVADHDAAALAALEPVLDVALGAVCYTLGGLSPLGAPTESSTLKVTGKSGVAAGISSRADEGALLTGTKRMVVRSPRLWVGHGKRDGRSLLMVPLYARGRVAALGLVHLRFRADLELPVRARALRALGRYEDLKCAVTEWDIDWSDELLEPFSSEELLTGSAEKLAEAIRERRPEPVAPRASERGGDA